MSFVAGEHQPTVVARRQASEEKPVFRQEQHALPPHKNQMEEMKLNTEIRLSTSSSLSNHQDAVTTTTAPSPPPPPAPFSSPSSWKDYMQNETFLYRSEQVATVVRWFEEHAEIKQKQPQQGGESSHSACSSSSDSGLLLVTGPAGVGKTRLVQQALQNHRCIQDGGFFLTGKFDQFQHPVPHRGFVEAFTEFTHLLLMRQKEEKHHSSRGGHFHSLKKSILEAVGNETCVLTSMVPALEQILKEDEECHSNNVTDHQQQVEQEDACPLSKADVQRFVYCFRMFLRAVSSVEHPVLLLMDDLHYADLGSLDLFTSIVTHLDSSPGLFVAATYEADQDSESYLSRKLREIGETVTITEVSVGNLDEGEVNHLLGNALQLPRLDQIADLGNVVIAQTRGNPFYIHEFFQWLEGTGLLMYDSSDGWSWDADEIRVSMNACSVGDFLTRKLARLPLEMLDVLKVGACLGSHVEEDLIGHVLGRPVQEHVAQAAHQGLLKMVRSTGKYMFVHDGMQKAAYNLIPEEERELFHLEIGRRLWRRLKTDDLDRQIFVLLSQMNIGKRLITREKERYAIADLCFHAGKKAAKSSAFRTASVYLNLAVDLLGSRSWRDEYNLTLAIHNAAAEMEMCTANFDKMEVLIAPVLEHARMPEDKIQARATQMYAWGNTDRQQDALDLGIQVLAGLGERFPRRLCKQHLKREMKQIRRLLKSKSNDYILRMMDAQDSKVLAALQILSLMFLHALLARPKLAPFITLKCMKLTLTEGLSLLAPPVFATYGMLCVSVGEYESGIRFGELGLELLAKLRVREYLPRVFVGCYGCIFPCKKPIRDSLEPLLHAYEVGMETGDLEFASLALNMWGFCTLESCSLPLSELERQWAAHQETMRSNKFTTLLRMSDTVMQCIHHYMGLSPGPLGSKGDLIDTDEVLQYCIKNKLHNSALGIRFARMQVLYVFNDFDAAFVYAQIVLKHMWTMPPIFEVAISAFMVGLVLTASARQGVKIRSNITQAKKNLDVMKKFALLCPANFSDKKFLLEAELAAVLGKRDEAFELYCCAIALARENGFVFIQALANERTARFLMAGNKLDDALPYFREACHCYDQWGGQAKVSCLREELKNMEDDTIIVGS